MGQKTKSDSPCTDICRIDEATGLCVGCLRSLEEIARWTTFSESERRAVNAALKSRRPAAGD